MTRVRSSAIAPFAVLLALFAGRAAPASAQGADPPLKVEPCTVSGVDGPARCGTLRVWENREARSGRKIGIRFIVLPATGAAPAKEAVAYFSGGPGQSAIDGTAYVAAELAAARGTRDLLFMDARGTGGSNPLPCDISTPGDLQSYLVEFFTVEGVKRCAEALAPRADVRLYTSARAADDLDELRTMLGYETLNLYGVSYGTRTALVYLRRHPAHVRAVLMHGSVPTDLRYPLTVAPDAQLAIDGVFGECARAPGCHAAFPDLAADLRASLRRLDAGPAEAPVVSPLDGRVATVRLSRDRYTEALRAMLYDASSASLIPAVVHRAARGDFGPAAEQELSWRFGLTDGSSRGLYLAVTCPEDVAFIDTAEAARLARGTFLGTWRVADQKAACAAWPYRPLDRSFVEPVRSRVPVLVMNGEWDPATARHHAERLLRGFPNGRMVVIPSAGHGTGGLLGVQPCYGDIVAEFIRTADARGVDASCMTRVRRPPFPTELAGAVVELDSAALARFAGRYATPGKPPVEMRVVDGRLHAIFPDQDIMLLPLGPARFRPAGGPHVFVTFRETNGAVTGFDLVMGGGPPESFVRADAPPAPR
jgi:pimeloyl-ACP methyl ester carboxylesterase